MNIFWGNSEYMIYAEETEYHQDFSLMSFTNLNNLGSFIHIDAKNESKKRVLKDWIKSAALSLLDSKAPFIDEDIKEMTKFHEENTLWDSSLIKLLRMIFTLATSRFSHRPLNIEWKKLELKWDIYRIQILKYPRNNDLVINIDEWIVNRETIS